MSGQTYHSEVNTLLQMQMIRGGRKGGRQFQLNVLWDAGSTMSFITTERAKELNLLGKPIKLEIITVGGETKVVNSNQYRLSLMDKAFNEVSIEVFGLDAISSGIAEIHMDKVAHLFKCKVSEINRPSQGQVDILIGYQYAAFHPARLEAIEHLLLLQNQFEIIIAGSHSAVIENTQKLVNHAVVHYTQNQLETFYELENLSITSSPRCGSCKCGECHIGGKCTTLKEESEYKLIEENLTYHHQTKKWEASMPWVQDPKLLPDNRWIALATLKSTERRLLKNPNDSIIYKRQIDDMLERKVAREVSSEELSNYDGPKYYISHHAVMKAESPTTPCRIVFNSSAKYQGKSLNDFLAKGPSMLNQLLGVLLRFRRERVAFIGDIAKMFHAIGITVLDQMTHLFLWRNLDLTKDVKTYPMTAVNMGDRPSATIAQVAVRKTAGMAGNEYSEAKEIIVKNSYKDDIPGSAKSREAVKKSYQ